MLDPEQTLASDIGGLACDPLAFVRYAFPWGSGELTGSDGPDTWQTAVLEDIGRALRNGSMTDALRMAVASGHGVGKSALVSWLILWAMCTCPDTRGVVTANTENQLRTKTWAELAKWKRLCVCGNWFDCTATALISRTRGHEKLWRMDAVPWSENNTEAFAGLHNQGRRVLVVFDEASAIPDVIWEVTEGALTDTDTEIVWCAFGNPTRNTGRFHDVFGRYQHRWNCRRVDSRTAKMTNKKQLAAWVQDYGEDSDFVRVRVRGEFPQAGSSQFVSTDLVSHARGRDVPAQAYEHAARIIGLDVARFGDDASVLTKRQGNHCAPQIEWRGLDLMQLCGRVAREIQTYHPDAVFVDGVGVGAGVVDRLRELGFQVVDVQSGARALEPARYQNRRAEMWAQMRDWLQSGSIPDDDALCQELTGIEYGFSSSGALHLEKKSDMKSRGLHSPDHADSLAMTFYAPVAARSEWLRVERMARNKRQYDPLAW